MPRATNLSTNSQLIKGLIMGVEKSGKTDWAARAALAGFNVLYLDGDVAAATIHQLPPEARKRIFYLDFGDDFAGGKEDTRMIDLMYEFFTSTKFVWNDSKEDKFTLRQYDSEADEVWVIYPGKLDWRWVVVLDSWTTLSYSGMVSKAKDLGVSIADVEKVNREIYAGVGNRLTNMASIIQKMPCHVIVIGHPDEYQKKKAPDRVTVREAKELDMEIEWTRMIPKSSSKPHGLTLGKFFTDCGWMDVTRGGRRELNFKLDVNRSSGGHLDSKGDPRESHSFENLVRAIGGTIPDPNRPEDILPVLEIYGPGEYQTASAKPIAPIAGGTVKGVGGLAGLKKSI